MADQPPTTENSETRDRLADTVEGFVYALERLVRRASEEQQTAMPVVRSDDGPEWRELRACLSRMLVCLTQAGADWDEAVALVRTLARGAVPNYTVQYALGRSIDACCLEVFRAERARRGEDRG